MANAKKDIEQLGMAAPDIYCKLANIGSGGTQKGNMHRDLQKLVHVQVPPGFQVDVPVRGHQPGTWRTTTQHMLLPHELFAYMWENKRNAFVEFVQGPPGQIEGFWTEMADSPQLAAHPLRLEPDYQHTAIPIAIHGDGVPVTGVGKSWSKSCDIYSWASLLGGGRMALKQGGLARQKKTRLQLLVWGVLLIFLVSLLNNRTLDTNYYIWSVFQHTLSKVWGHTTMINFWVVLNWSLTSLYHGRWPTADPWGVPYAEGTDEGRRANLPLQEA